MRNPFDPFADLRHILDPMLEIQRQLESIRIPDIGREIESQVVACRAAVGAVASHYSNIDLGSIVLRPIEIALNHLDLGKQASSQLLASTDSMVDTARSVAEAASWVGRIDISALELPGLTPALSKAFQVGMYPPFPSLVATIQQAAQTVAGSLPEIRSFASVFAERTAQILRAVSEEELEEALLAAGAEFENRLPAAQKDRISFEAWLSIVLTLLLFIASQESQLKSEKRIVERLSHFEAELLSKLEPPDDMEAEKLMEVSEVIDVRAEPSRDSTHCGFLFPGRSVRVQTSDPSGWVRIEFFNDFDGEPSAGWVEAKYLTNRDAEAAVP